MLKEAIATAKTVGKKLIFKASQKSPEILLVAGLVGVAAGFVMAAVESPKVKQVVEETKAELEDVTKLEEANDIPKSKRFQHVMKVIVKGVWKFIRVFGAAIGIEAAGIGFIIWSYAIKQKRYLGALSTVELLTSSFAAYRKRVVADAGEDKDFEYLTGTKKKLVKKIIEHEDGTTETIKEKEFTAEEIPSQPGENLYGRFFDEFNNPGGNWTKSPLSNAAWLKAVEKQANYILESRGWLYLNELYMMLGYEPTWYGGIVGWLKEGEINGIPVAGHISFRCKDIYKTNPTERSYFLDFNCDGVITDELRTRDKVKSLANKRMQEMMQKAWKAELAGVN